jgi:tetratricopeptide (TPR) repeat protein
MALVLGFTLTASGWAAAKAQLCRRAAARLNNRAGSADERIAYLESAVATAPDFARVRLELAQVHREVFEQRRDELEETVQDDDTSSASKLDQLTREHLVPALTHYLFARDLCPLLGEPHLQIAAHAVSLEQADSQSVYFARARMLIPFDPAVWYLTGLNDLLDGREAEAWMNWRRSLELSDLFLHEIVSASVAALGDQGLISEVLPDRPDLLVRAAFFQYPNVNQKDERRPFFEKARSVFESKTEPATDAEDSYMEATVHRALGEWQPAIDAYAAALRQRPDQVEWRYELAELLFDLDRIDDAHRELVRILQQQSGHARARVLYIKVSRLLAERK